MRNNLAINLFRFLIEQGFHKKEVCCITLRPGMGYDLEECEEIALTLNLIFATSALYKFTVKSGNFNRNKEFDNRSRDTGVFTIFLSTVSNLSKAEELTFFSE